MVSTPYQLPLCNFVYTTVCDNRMMYDLGFIDRFTFEDIEEEQIRSDFMERKIDAALEEQCFLQ